jgi:hypothetical protein
MTVNAKATFFANFSRVVAFFLSVAILIFGIVVGDSSSIDADPYGYFTFLLVLVFMLLWSITDWEIIEVEL